jgi:hypothetical protein
MNRDECSQQLLTVRTLVAALGEQPPSPWWRTQFLTEAGLRVTTRIFPRTAVAAAINSVSEAARRDHDARVGVGRRYHLFRLPTEWEDGLATSLMRQESQAEVKQLLQSGPERLLSKLESLAQGSKRVGKEGPIALGSAALLRAPGAIAELAAHYFHAFTHSQRCYPYFEHEEGRA